MFERVKKRGGDCIFSGLLTSVVVAFLLINPALANPISIDYETYSDCLLGEVPKAQTDRAASLIRGACQRKFSNKSNTTDCRSFIVEFRNLNEHLRHYNWLDIYGWLPEAYQKDPEKWQPAMDVCYPNW